MDHEKRRKLRIYEPLPISIFDPKILHEKLTTDLQGNLVHSQLLIQCLLKMKPEMDDKQNLVTVSRKIYKKNRAERKVIDEFEQYYKPDQAICWYTRDSFVWRLLNKALRTQNIDMLFVFHFFIADMQEQLKSLQCKSRILVYCSQLMSKDKLENMKASKGQFISVNSFFSATVEKDKAVSYLSGNDEQEKVLFIIDADPTLSGDKPFANIKKYSYDKEEEILFMLGSIFQVIDCRLNDKQIWEFQLKLFSSDSERINFNRSKEQLFSFGHVLMTIGNLDEAEIYYKRLLNGIPAKNADQARCYKALGKIADERKDYESSLDFHQQALTINQKHYGEPNSYVASNYNSIGEIYQKKRDYSKALDSYNKALGALGKDPQDKDLLKQALFYNNMGVVRQEEKDYEKALNLYQKAYDIRKNVSPVDETSLGMSCNNIGNANYLLKRYDIAIRSYQDALKIYKKNLPPQHPKIASVYNNIGAVLDDKGDLKEALWYYDQARSMYGNIYPATHPNIIRIQENIDRLTSGKRGN